MAHDNKEGKKDQPKAAGEGKGAGKGAGKGKSGGQPKGMGRLPEKLGGIPAKFLIKMPVSVTSKRG